jgi:hypothetical protein
VLARHAAAAAVLCVASAAHAAAAVGVAVVAAAAYAAVLASLHTVLAAAVWEGAHLQVICRHMSVATQGQTACLNVQQHKITEGGCARTHSIPGMQSQCVAVSGDANTTCVACMRLRQAPHS